MSNTKISDPSEVVSIGDPLFVKVIEIKVGNNVGTWSNFAHSLTRSHAHSFTLHSFTLSLLHSPILTHPLTHPLTYIWFSPWLQDDGKIAVSMKSVRQSDGTDTDPTNILIEQERLRKQKVTDNERPPLELGAVLNTVCAKCGLKGHFAKDCFSQGKQYSVVEANSEEEQLEEELEQQRQAKQRKREARHSHSHSHGKNSDSSGSGSESSDSDDGSVRVMNAII